MVDRYRALLVKDTGAATVVPPISGTAFRGWSVGVSCCIGAGLLCLVAIEPGVGRFIFGAIALALGWGVRSAFRREHAIVLNPSEAVGTILDCARTGRKGRAHVKYGFLGSDDRIYLGNFIGSVKWLKKKGQTVTIVYRVDNPARNLPLSEFWFHRFLR